MVPAGSWVLKAISRRWNLKATFFASDSGTGKGSPDWARPGRREKAGKKPGGQQRAACNRHLNPSSQFKAFFYRGRREESIRLRRWMCGPPFAGELFGLGHLLGGHQLCHDVTIPDGFGIAAIRL